MASVLIYAISVTAVFGLFNWIIRKSISRHGLPAWLSRKAMLAFLLILNLLDWATLKYAISRVGPVGAESNPFIRFVLEGSILFGDIFKLLIGSAFMVTLAFSKSKEVPLATMLILGLVLIFNSVAIGFLL